MKTIHFLPNEPQLLALKDPSGVIDGFNVLYECTDGRILSLPRPAAVKLNELDPAPGEEFSATKHQEPRQPAEWVFSLTAQSERARAAKDEETAIELEKATRQNLERQLSKSLAIRQMPKVARKLNAEGPDTPKGTGTYGPLPQVALGSRKTRESIPMDVAFGEIVTFVTKTLNDSGEQWSEQSRQDLCSTVIIAAAKQGLLGVWQR